MRVCSMPRCQTTAGCVCASALRPVFNGLQGFTDEEIAREHAWRLQRRLGDKRECVGQPTAHP